MAPNRFGANVMTCEVFPADNVDQEELRAMILSDVNARLPEAAQIQQVIFRAEDFKRTGSMKIVREQ